MFRCQSKERKRKGRGAEEGFTVKCRPILFSGEMVRAILEGRKTQTRRVITRRNSLVNGEPASQALWDALDFSDAFVDSGPSPAGNAGPYLKAAKPDDETRHRVYSRLWNGDRLWVRETWRVESFMESEPVLFGYKDGQTMEENGYGDTPDYEDWYERICIQSTDDAAKAYEKGLARKDGGDCYLWSIGSSPCRWRPSIFMPRWASRITLEITNIRAERLQEITEDDAKAEGPNQHHSWPDNYYCTWIGAFHALWDSINAKRGYPWESNPWVWVIEFRRIKQ